MDNKDIVQLFKELYEDIKHGDEEHQLWLKTKIYDVIEHKLGINIRE